MTRHLLQLAAATMLAVGLMSATSADDPEPDLKMEIRESAKPVVRTAPRYPAVELKQRRQGWVQLSYVITDEGEIVDPVVEASSGSSAFEREALRTVENWKYTPATWNGSPVQQCATKVMITFALEGQESTVGRDFNRGYRRATKALEDGDIESARERVDQLAKNDGLTLSETAWLWALRARIAGRSNDRDAQLRALREATRGSAWIDDELLPGMLYIKAALELERGQLSDGLNSYDRLLKVDPDMAEIERLKPHIERVQSLVASEQALSFPGSIDSETDCEDCAKNWHYDPLRRKFSIANVNGDLGDIELRCDWRRAKGKAEEGMTWEVPESWGKCSVIVFGEPGTTFDFVELPLA